MTAGSSPNHERDRKVLSFHVGNQNYAVDILSVRKIRGWSKPTLLPHAPAYLRGVINLRGSVLPLIDLAIRLGASENRLTHRDVIIVVRVDGLDAGLLVSAVSDILTLQHDALQPAPGTAVDGATGFIEGMAVHDGAIIRLLDLSAVVRPQYGLAA
ncbi:MAG: chemotaxis protein CheW [Pseudomonadota bacterium]